MFRKKKFCKERVFFSTKKDYSPFPFQALFNPFLILYNAKCHFLPLTAKIFLPFPLSVSTSIHPRCQDTTINATLLNSQPSQLTWRPKLAMIIENVLWGAISGEPIAPLSHNIWQAMVLWRWSYSLYMQIWQNISRGHWACDIQSWATNPIRAVIFN